MQKLSLIVAIACAAVTSADARLGQASQAYHLGHTEIYCECTNGCPGMCLSPNASRLVTPLFETAGPSDSSAAWSPDGTKVAYQRGYDIVVTDAAGSNAVNVIAAASIGPAWSPDGTRIAFASNRTGAPELYVMNPDGSNVVRVTTQAGVVLSRPTWAPDSNRMAFTCEADPGNRDICVIGVNGSDLLRLTAGPASDEWAAWSPDGATIAFTTTRYGAGPQLATMGADGSNVARIGSGIMAWEPAWSPDGLYLAFTSGGSESLAVYVMRVGDSEAGWAGDFKVEPAWMPLARGVLIARMSVWCERLTCTFSASGSLGLASAYSWSFGDGGTASGVTVTHTYAEGGSYDFAVTLSGEDGATATAHDSLALNRPPVASFTVACEGVSCIFDWSASYDPEGGQLDVNWSFGDGGGGLDPVEGRPHAGRHVYPAPGTYTAAIRVTDPSYEVSTASQTITVNRGAMHVGDIDATAGSLSSPWSATVTITMHDEGHRPLANAVVSASWNGGPSVSCTTGAAGSCVLTKSKIPRKASVDFTVLGASNNNFFYAPTNNHDPDGGSNGTTISISRQ